MALSRFVLRGTVLCLLLVGVGCSTFSGSGGGSVPIEKRTGLHCGDAAGH